MMAEETFRPKIDDDLRLKLIDDYRSTGRLPPLLVRGTLLEADSPNLSKWGLLSEDLRDFVDSTNERIRNADVISHRMDHQDTVNAIAGRVKSLEKIGKQVHFESEIANISDVGYKLLMNYAPYVSISCSSPTVLCSNCHYNVQMQIQDKQQLIRDGKYYSIKNGLITHLCDEDSWNVVRKPIFLNEISSVTQGSYRVARAYVVGIASES